MSRTSPLEMGMEYCPECQAYVHYHMQPNPNGDELPQQMICQNGHLIESPEDY